METRGHNWELLRQRAKATGLYLQTFEASAPASSFALLWVAEKDLQAPQPHKFDGQFLGISSPFSDERLRHWLGYSDTWYLDQDGGVFAKSDAQSDAQSYAQNGSPGGSPESRPARMIPLALYALDHPKVPLLMVDFRHAGPQRREIALKFAGEATSGMLALSGLGNLGFVAAKSSWLFVHGRHGGATNRAARRRAFVAVRHALGTDENIPQGLRQELLSRIERIDINPIERTWAQEVRDAWQQYNVLLAHARKTELSAEINRDRDGELRAMTHTMTDRALLRMATLGTAGLYRHHEKLAPSALAQIEQQRRLQYLNAKATPVPPAPKAVLARDAEARDIPKDSLSTTNVSKNDVSTSDGAASGAGQ